MSTPHASFAGGADYVKRNAAAGLSEEELRDLAQQHYDGRRMRLEAYALWLEDALAVLVARPGTSAHLVRLASQLEIVRRELQSAARPRVPRGHVAPPLDDASLKAA